MVKVSLSHVTSKTGYIFVVIFNLVSVICTGPKSVSEEANVLHLESPAQIVACKMWNGNEGV